MVVLVILILILTISFGIKIKLKISQEESLFLALFGMTFLVYIFGLFELLNIGIYVIGVFGFISTIYTITKLIKKEEKIKNLFTLATLIYIAVVVLIYYIVKDLKFAEYDDFMFWGINLKEMFTNSCLWANAKIDGIHLTYPPFTAVTEYIFCKVHGEFNEGISFFGMTTLIFTSIMPLFKNEKYNVKSLFKILTIIAITYVAIILFPFSIATLLVDCMLGIVFAVAMYLAYSIKDKRDYIVITAMLITLTLTKTNGMLFSAIVIMQIFLKNLFELIKQKERNVKNITKKFSIVLILLAIVLASYASWKIYYTANGKEIDDRHDKNYVDNVNLKEFLNSILFKDEANDRNKMIVERFWDKLFEEKITNQNNKNTAIWIFVIVNISYIIYISSNKEKTKILANVIGINIGFILYLLTLLLVFMFIFQKNQGEELLSFRRYMSTYMLSMILNLVYLLKDKDKSNLILLVIISLMISELNLSSIAQTGVRNMKSNIKEENISEILENVKLNEKVYIVSKKQDGGIEWVQLRYAISPIRTNLLYEFEPVNTQVGKKDIEKNYQVIALTEEEFMKKLINEKYDWLYIASVNEEFIEDYKNMFTDEILVQLKEKIKNNEQEEKGILIKVSEIYSK